MPNLPTPRDERPTDEELRAVVESRSTMATLPFVRAIASELLERRAAIPPVGEGMPTLAHQWGVIDRDGDLRRGPFRERRDAEYALAGFDGITFLAPYRVVRLTIAEVYDPPAPDSWEKWAADVNDWLDGLHAAGYVGHAADHERFKARRAALLAGKGES